jgi:hypothetical protein
MRHREPSFSIDETVSTLAPSRHTIATFDRAFSDWLERHGQTDRNWKTHRFQLRASGLRKPSEPRSTMKPQRRKPGTAGVDGRTREEWYQQLSRDRIAERNKIISNIGSDGQLFGMEAFAHAAGTSMDSARRILRDACHRGDVVLARPGRSGRNPIHPLYRLPGGKA